MSVGISICLSSSTKSSTVQIICPPIPKWPNPSTAVLVRYSLCKLNRIGDKQRHCLTPLLFFILLVSSLSLTQLSMYNVSIILCPRQYKFPAGFALNWSSLHSQMSSASLWNKQTILHLCPKCVLILFLSSQLHPYLLYLF